MKKTTKTKKPQYSIKLTIADKVYTGKGETALEALTSIKKPEKIIYKGILSITDGVRKSEILMYPVRLKRLFYKKFFQAIQLKSIVMTMK